MLWPTHSSQPLRHMPCGGRVGVAAFGPGSAEIASEHSRWRRT
jgi:hypothetical protein